MIKEIKSIIHVQGLSVNIVSQNQDDYISITDIARHRDSERSDYILQNWLRNRSTIEFIGLWEQLKNPHFNSIEFDGIKNMAGSNSFSLTPKRWIEATNAIGIISKTGRYGGTFAHRDIAFEFASWVSAEFKMYLIVEFQRLKDDENQRLSLAWNLNRTLAKINYRIHTDAIKENIIPPDLTKEQQQIIYASEADVLNVAMFGKTAQQWRMENPGKEGNIRDYSSIEQLLVLANMESMNAEFIRMELPQTTRLQKLNAIAITQLKSLAANANVGKLNKKK
ncbi:MAG: DNA-binding protein [Bacteroidetes bacterium RIFOXYA12_FULL_35_11]|nr:MAG: DNA-binding protein [Bacteroidetes bacterium GWF2_35_48]OFY74190.1 MAG: DNA-binding protein [Bacteroidetes bacterium RIFOXYA12_FULL_35_11]OFY93795.1 MAG: DNA-binding protein [Bacteroidetes bacterium RIFOXYC12_FULL_35_7]OFY96742.1 MAG: DNA-binding protein [Bacteroidetes bacterium RIFOXYB2_FULL_35_7]HBX52379.1 DNA-binding protein [Bacteroidales bacterium]